MTKEEIRNVLAPMLRGDSIWVSGIKVYFTVEGVFVVPAKYSEIPNRTSSLKEAVEYAYKHISTNQETCYADISKTVVLYPHVGRRSL